MEQYTKSEFKLDNYDGEGFITWRAPSNIALVKYWGKKEDQIPQNSSISFTLDNATTTTTLRWMKGDGQVSFEFEGQESKKFQEKIEKYFTKLTPYFPFLKQLNFKLSSENTFPHSAGIASSASSMASIALCLVSLEEELLGKKYPESDFFKKASFMARLGSGSASRSVYGGVVSWGNFLGSESNTFSNEFATKHDKLSEKFNHFKDAILIVDSGAKPVSSTQGHALMNSHPFRDVRYKNANDNVLKLIELMNKGDISSFGELVEKEALELHGLMMNSTPSFILMRPETLTIIEKIRDFRNKMKVDLYFTLDAGPNVHLLYPDNVAKEVEAFIQSELVTHLEEGRWIQDQVGNGPVRIK